MRREHAGLGRWGPRLLLVVELLVALAAVAALIISLLAYLDTQDRARRQQAEQVIGVSLDAVEQAEVIYGGNEDGSDKFSETDPPRLQNYSRLPVDEVMLAVTYDEGVMTVLEVGQLLPCQEALVGPLLVMAAPEDLDLEQSLPPGAQAYSFVDVAGRYWFREGFGEPVRMPSASGGLIPAEEFTNNQELVTRPIAGCVPA